MDTPEHMYNTRKLLCPVQEQVFYEVCNSFHCEVSSELLMHATVAIDVFDILYMPMESNQIIKRHKQRIMK